MGPPAGDGRYGADQLPCWVDYDAAFYGIPAIDGRGHEARPGPLRAGVRSVARRADRRPGIGPSGAPLPRAPVPGARRRPRRRDARLPVRDDAGHELRHRPPPRLRQRAGWSAAARATGSSTARSSASTWWGGWPGGPGPTTNASRSATRVSRARACGPAGTAWSRAGPTGRSPGQPSRSSQWNRSACSAADSSWLYRPPW